LFERHISVCQGYIQAGWYHSVGACSTEAGGQRSGMTC
jgi:hypothetical protein